MRYGIRMKMPGVTQEQYDALHAQLAVIGADAEGFVAHIAGPTQGGWYVIEVWESKAHLERFMQSVVALMPPGAPAPQIEIVEEFEVHSRQTKEQMIA
jgi:quinol monooxygenase YgiN